jgi:hypothetical protein
METSKKMALQDMFPLISGNIADYEVVIPQEYTAHFVSINDQLLGTGPFSNNSLVGLKDDIENLLSQAQQGNAISFKDASQGVFRARFTPDTGIDDQGRFIDRTNGPLDVSLYEGMGMTNVGIKNGLFQGIQGVPMFMITGDMKGSRLRMLYLYSPVDNLVVLFSLQGGQDQQKNDIVWNAFAESF